MLLLPEAGAVAEVRLALRGPSCCCALLSWLRYHSTLPYTGVELPLLCAPTPDPRLGFCPTITNLPCPEPCPQGPKSLFGCHYLMVLPPP